MNKNENEALSDVGAHKSECMGGNYKMETIIYKCCTLQNNVLYISITSNA